MKTIITELYNVESYKEHLCSSCLSYDSDLCLGCLSYDYDYDYDFVFKL